jgi:hypothetical protein
MYDMREEVAHVRLGRPPTGLTQRTLKDTELTHA